MQDLEMHQLAAKQSNSTLPCSPLSARFVYLASEVNIQRKINLDHTLQSAETQKVLDDLYEKYKDIFS